MEYLLDLDGQIMDMGRGHWVKIEARPVPPTPGRPAGVNYSLCLFGPEGERLLCYDNAHAVRDGTGPAAARRLEQDHVPQGRTHPPL